MQATGWFQGKSFINLKAVHVHEHVHVFVHVNDYVYVDLVVHVLVDVSGSKINETPPPN
jgi:hypothetical protein